MEDGHVQPARNSLFARLLAEKRNKAGLSLSQLAALAGLPLSFLEALETGRQPAPSFDLCYQIAVAINSHARQCFLVNDLWQAASVERDAISSGLAPAGQRHKVLFFREALA
jgi:transcriptional regulator with XRE-family HTH domain